jgi:hypothetical protein
VMVRQKVTVCPQLYVPFWGGGEVLSWKLVAQGWAHTAAPGPMQAQSRAMSWERRVGILGGTATECQNT